MGEPASVIEISTVPDGDSVGGKVDDELDAEDGGRLDEDYASEEEEEEESLLEEEVESDSDLMIKARPRRKQRSSPVVARTQPPISRPVEQQQHSSPMRNPESSDGGKKRRNFGCGECDEFFATHRKLLDHTRDVHNLQPATNKIYMCSCRKKFESAAYLKVHEKDCRGPKGVMKPFPCNICEKRFKFQEVSGIFEKVFILL